MKTRNEIITDCVQALKACYNYYSDEPLPGSVESAVFAALSRTLPKTIPTLCWQQLADNYKKRMAAE